MATKVRRQQTIIIKDFLGGYNSRDDDDRLAYNTLKKSDNMIVDQNGTLRPRPSLILYGTQPIGTVLGQPTPFIKMNGTTPEKWEASMQAIKVNAVQTLTISGAPTGGTFTLTYSGQTTGALAFNATAGNVQSALEALTNIGVGQVVASGGPLPATAITLTFQGTLANTNVATLTTTASLTGGTTPTATVAVTTTGGPVANVYVRKDDGGTFTKITGKNFDTTVNAHFEQIGGLLVVTNGIDIISYITISTLAIASFTALTTPTGLTATPTALTGTLITYYYQVTAMNQGETAATATASVTIGKTRNNWSVAAGEFVTIGFNRVTGAGSYGIYIGTTPTNGVLLDTIPDPGSGTTVSYKDDSRASTNTLRLAPVQNSTQGPRVTRTKNIAGVIYMVGDKDNPYRLWYGSNKGVDPLNFTDEQSGGYVDIDKDGINFPVAVTGFRDKSGQPLVTVLSRGIGGRGTLTNIQTQVQTIGSDSYTYLQLSQSESQTGTDAPDAVINYQQALWYFSRDGFKTSYTKSQLQNLISTETFSGGIINDIPNINVNALDKACGAAYQNRLYYGLPVGASSNSQIWVFDLDTQRPQVWTLPWYISADALWVSDDNSGTTRFKCLSNNQIYFFSYTQLTLDGSSAFSTNAITGLIKAEASGNDWMTVSSVKITYLRPRGTINFSVAGKTEDSNLVTLAADSYVASTTSASRGWNESVWNALPWNKVGVVPTTFGMQAVTRYLEVEEDVNYLQLTIGSTGAGVDFQVSKIVITYTNIGPNDDNTN